MIADKQEAIAIYTDLMYRVDKIENVSWPLWPMDVMIYRPRVHQSLMETYIDNPGDLGPAGVVLLETMTTLRLISDTGMAWEVLDQMQHVVEDMINSDLTSVSTAGVTLMDCWTNDH